LMLAHGARKHRAFIPKNHYRKMPNRSFSKSRSSHLQNEVPGMFMRADRSRTLSQWPIFFNLLSTCPAASESPC